MLVSRLLPSCLILAATVSGADLSIARPELPRAWVNTAYPAMTGRTLNVPAGGNVQTAIDQALLGDTVVLQAGATYMGNLRLTRKTGTGWIVIRSSALGTGLPRAGTRVGPQHSAAMPKIVTPNSVSAIMADPGAHHYRLVGLEIATTPSSSGVPNIVLFLNSNPSAITSDMNTDMVIDRCYIHGHPGAQLTRRGVGMQGARIAVIDSHISEMHDYQDAQAIAGWAGPGPYRIFNNYLEATGENIFFFGYDGMPAELISSDIEIRGNHIRKSPAWNPASASFGGIRWPVKNLFESKASRRVLIDGNIFENNWAGADQQGFAILIACNGDAGANCRNEDITFTNNIVRNSSAGINIAGVNLGIGYLNRVLVSNNVFERVGGILFQVLNRANDVTIEHNTGFNGHHPLFMAYDPSLNFVFRNNIINHSTYGMFVSSYGSGTAGLTVNAPPADTLNSRVTHNVLIKASAHTYIPPEPGITWTPLLEAVAFTSVSTGNYRLSLSSPYRGKATDGTDVGVNVTTLEAATRNTISGVSTAPHSQISFTPIRVNAGGPAFTDSTGLAWAADTGFSGGRTHTSSFSFTASPQHLYKTCRWDTGPLEYRFNVLAGTYRLRLRFAEPHFTTAGKRIFNILLNGSTVESNFDSFAISGGLGRAADRTYAVNASGGSIVIRLNPVLSNPYISGIEILAP